MDPERFKELLVEWAARDLANPIVPADAIKEIILGLYEKDKDAINAAIANFPDEAAAVAFIRQYFGKGQSNEIH